MIRNILWDFDGTLVDTYPAMTYALSQTLRSMGISMEFNLIDGLVRRSLTDCIETIHQRYGASTEDIQAGFRSHYRAIPPVKQPLFPGVVEVCQAVLKASGANVIVTHRRTESTMQILGAHSAAHLFAGVISSQDGFPPKPDPDMVREAIRRHRLNPAQTLLVGDRELDIQAGAAAGVATCLFGDAKTGQAPDYHIHNYAELSKILARGERRAQVSSD
jgi:HAD superfamily hydrolase (TIGR01509 family)